MSTNISEIKRIVCTNPNPLKFMFKSPTEDKHRLTRVISHMLPYRVGVEFETFGAVGQNLFLSYPKYELLSTKDLDKKIRGYYRICDFREDYHKFPVLNQVTDGQDLNEVRVSFYGYKQLIPFWYTIQDLKKYLVIPKLNGGIHIHIDAKFVSDDKGKNYAIKWFNQPTILNRVLQIFEGYNGTYNKRGASEVKGYWIRVTSYPTIEFRIARLTYEYKTLIRWIIACSDLVRRCKTDYLYNRIAAKSLDEIKLPSHALTLSVDDITSDVPTELVTQNILNSNAVGITNLSTDGTNNQDYRIYQLSDGNYYTEHYRF